jgi:hypothetical protein
MTTVHTNTISVHTFEPYGLFDQAELAAAAYLARYSGRTLDAYRHDLRTFFQWAGTVGLARRLIPRGVRCSAPLGEGLAVH